MEHNIYKEATLNSTRDYKNFANELDNAMLKVAHLDNGVYTISKNDKHILLMLENFTWFQLSTNRGIRVLGSGDALKMEIYDYRRVMNEPKTQKNFNL